MSSDTTHTAGTAPTPDPRRWIALVVLLAAGFMDLLDVTIVNVALPSIQDSLDARYSELEWIVAAYALSFAAVLITGGRLGDIFGRKRMFLIGVAGFTVASTLCGLATSGGMLVAARFLQGGMAALMVPQILSIMHVTFPQGERGKVFGLYGAIVGSASVAGPILAGLLVHWDIAGLAWRPIFLINIPVGIATMIGAAIFIRESRSPTAFRLDLVGVVLATLGIVMLVYPLTQGRSEGWPLWTFAMIAGAVPVLAAFVLYERRRARTVGSPLVVLSLFRLRAFNAGLGVWMLFNLALGGFFLVWTLYMQVGLGWSALHAGLTSVAFAFGAAPAAGMSVQVLTPRFGRRVLMAGALINALGFALYIWQANAHGTDITSWQMVPVLLVCGVGFGLVVAPLTDLVISGVPKNDAGSASGLFTTIQQLGLAFGVALVGVLFFSVLASHATRSASDVAPALRQELAAAGVPAGAQNAIVTQFSVCLHDRSAASDPTAVPASCQALQSQSAELPPAAADQIAQAVGGQMFKASGENFSHAFVVTLSVGIGILLLVFGGMFALPRKVRATEDQVTGEAVLAV